MKEQDNKCLEKLVRDMAEIKNALLGTPYTQKGIVKRVEDLETDMKSLNVIRWKITGASAGIASVVSIIAGLVFKLI